MRGGYERVGFTVYVCESVRVWLDGAVPSSWFPISLSHTGAQAISAGYSHSMVLKQDGSVWTTGVKEYGGLGDGTTRTYKNLFVMVVSSGQLGEGGTEMGVRARQGCG